jgi:hypothetical protein
MNKLRKFFANIKEKMPDIVEKSFDETKEEYLSLNKEQLLEGKTNKGENMPSYFDDVYFKTKEAAKKYSDWKDRITPNPKRQKGISNLYINGMFHNSIDISVRNKALLLRSTMNAEDIEAKNPDIYGLNGEKLGEYKETLNPEIIKNTLSEIKNLSNL